VTEARADAFDAARRRLQTGKRRRRPVAQAPQRIVPLEPAAPGEALQPSRLDAARERLRITIPPRADDD
jgi:hypothetical protein